MVDLKGKKFGKLTVIERFGSGRREGVFWLCKCACGKEKIINGRSLRNGNTKSCGCLLGNYNRLNPGLSNMRKTIINYKNSAKKRGFEYKLTEEQFHKITQKDCFYCGAKPNNKSKHKGRNGIYLYNGIDRVDNTKGYIIGNAVPCCKRCNHAKKDYTLREFQDWIKKVYKTSIKGQILKMFPSLEKKDGSDR